MLGGGGLVAKLRLTLSDSVGYSRPDSSVQGFSQARILEWVAISFSRGSSQPRDQTLFSCLVGRFFTTEPPRKPPLFVYTHGIPTRSSYRRLPASGGQLLRGIPSSSPPQRTFDRSPETRGLRCCWRWDVEEPRIPAFLVILPSIFPVSVLTDTDIGTLSPAPCSTVWSKNKVIPPCTEVFETFL